MGLSLPKSNLIFLKKCLDKWVHFTDGTELDISENKKTNLYNVDNTANENDFISEIEESEMSKTVLNEENIDPKELHAFNYNYINANFPFFSYSHPVIS